MLNVLRVLCMVFRMYVIKICRCVCLCVCYFVGLPLSMVVVTCVLLSCLSNGELCVCVLHLCCDCIMYI